MIAGLGATIGGFIDAASGGGSDPNFSSVKLLLGLDANATDESSAAHGTGTLVGNAQLDTSQKKFGAGSLLLDGSGDYLTFPDSTDWAFGTGQFTMEGFFRFAATPTNAVLLTQWDNGGGEFRLWFESGRLYFTDGNGHSSGTYTWSPSLNTWYHIAVDRDASNVLRIYVDGVMRVKITYAFTLFDVGGKLTIGSLRPYDTGYDLNGWVDEVRITKGVARYGSDGGFTVPTAAFPRS